VRNLVALGIIIVLIIAAIAWLNFSKSESKEVSTSSGKQVTTGVSEKQANTQAEEGRPAPDFTLVDFEGNIVKLSNLRGRPVFIDFWAKWCPFCTDEMPEIEKIHKEFGNDLVVIGIHRTNTESVSAGEDFAKNDAKVTYQILQDKTDEVYRAYTPSFAGMPVAAWIDKDGILVKLKIGPKTNEEIRENVKAIL
jgi:peroxiredoxin